jgi:hypothetical protein
VQPLDTTLWSGAGGKVEGLFFPGEGVGWGELRRPGDVVGSVGV